MAWTAVVKRLLMLAALSTTFAAPPLSANAIMEYSAYAYPPAATLGSTTLECPALCLEMEIFFFADTANIVPFSVPGASGYENFVGHGYVILGDGQTGQVLTANFEPNQIFVSIDQTNGGIGFGSLVGGGPTYPLGVYGGTPSPGAYSSYDLGCGGPCLPGKLAFNVGGFAWFCPPNTCTLGQAGPDLATDKGPLSITVAGLHPGGFDAGVFSVSSIPEPSSLLLVGSGIATFFFRRKYAQGLRRL